MGSKSHEDGHTKPGLEMVVPPNMYPSVPPMMRPRSKAARATIATEGDVCSIWSTSRMIDLWTRPASTRAHIVRPVAATWFIDRACVAVATTNAEPDGPQTEEVQRPLSESCKRPRLSPHCNPAEARTVLLDGAGGRLASRLSCMPHGSLIGRQQGACHCSRGGQRRRVG